jgi:hypothetical protein
MYSPPLLELLRVLLSHFFLAEIWYSGKARVSGLLVAQILF